MPRNLIDFVVTSTRLHVRGEHSVHDMYKNAHSYGIVAIDSVLCTHTIILHQPRNIKRQGTVAATRLDITLRLLWVQGLTLRLDLVQLQESLFCWMHPKSCSYLLHEVVSIAPPSLVPGVVLTSNANN